MPTLPSFSIRFDEQQLLDLAAKARINGAKRGYLHKADQKHKKLMQRWCCVYQNLLFYFESESCTKPLGTVFLEGTTCVPVEQMGQPLREVEAAFCISPDGSTARQYCFIAHSDKERDEWVQTITDSNMTKLQHELEELRDKCVYLESRLAASDVELQHIRRAHVEAQNDIVHLRASLSCYSPRSPRSPLRSPLRQQQTSKYTSPTPYDSFEEQVRVLQGYIRGWLIRRRWKNVVQQYLNSPDAAMMKKRNQLIWKFVASEEDYVSQLMVLNEEFRQQFEIAACSRRPPITLEQCKEIFRNCDELLLFHQLFLRGLHFRIEKWPVVKMGDVLRLFIPMLSIYHQYVGNHSHALDLLLSLRSAPSFKAFLDAVQDKPACKNLLLEELLLAPLKRISSYIQDLQELGAHTPTEHIDYSILHDTATELEVIQKSVTDEVSMSETIRQVLRVERKIEDGCDVLLDKEQVLVREGVLHQYRNDDKPTSSLSSSFSTSFTLSRNSKLRTQPRYCFLFSKHLLITTRMQKRPQDLYRLSKEVGVLPLVKCHIYEHHSSEYPELRYRAIKVECSRGDKTDTIVLLANSTNEKAQWMADFSQCVENEKLNKILQSQCLGEPVELSSRFIRYSTFRTGKEQLVNCGNVDSLLQRLVKVSYFGLDFLNTFLMTFPLYTDAHTVMDFLTKSYHDCVEKKEKLRRGSLSPHDAVRDARAFTSIIDSRSLLTLPRQNGLGSHAHLSPSSPTLTRRRGSASILEDTGSNNGVESSVTGIFFALKHWICKHFYHFQEDSELASKLEKLLAHASSSLLLMPNEKSAVVDVSRMYAMQKSAQDEKSPILELMKSQIHLPPKPFEVVLLWEPRDVAEQLCVIENTLFGRIGTAEILRHFMVKGDEKSRVAPNLAAIFDHFNRMSLFFMWSVVCQRYSVDRTKIMEFLIQLASECSQYNNFSSFMQVMSALDHGSVRKFKTEWEYVPKHLKQQYRSLMRLSSTDGRFKALREAMKRAHPPSVPYLGIMLNELSGVAEALPTHVEDDLVNFTKMRKCTRLITDVLENQKELYEFTFVPEISKVLLCTPIPGNEDQLYLYVQKLEEKLAAATSPHSTNSL